MGIGEQQNVVGKIEREKEEEKGKRREEKNDETSRRGRRKRGLVRSSHREGPPSNVPV